jgi:hypothetical protein
VALVVQPKNFTVLVPWVEPNPLPVIVMELPDKPDPGDMPVILGPVPAAAIGPLRETGIACTLPPTCLEPLEAAKRSAILCRTDEEFVLEDDEAPATDVSD